MHAPAEKNVKHKSDVLTWDQVPWDTCDLNFRPPSTVNASLSPGRAYSQLFLAAGGGMIATLLICYYAMQFLARRNAVEAIVVAGVVGLLIATGKYRLLPRMEASQTAASIAMLGGTTVLGLYFLVVIGNTQSLFAGGVSLLMCVALPLCLLNSDQATCQLVYWYSADPLVDRNTLVSLRNAWSGRFMTEHLALLRKRGISRSTFNELAKHWRSYVLVAAAFGLGSFLGFPLAAMLDSIRVGIVSVCLITALLVALALWTHAAKQDSYRTFCETLSLWFEYGRLGPMPPWMWQSPCGSQLWRAFLSYIATIFLAVSLFAICLADANWKSRTFGDLAAASLIELTAVALAVSVIAPTWILLCKFIVTAPMASACKQAILEVSDA